MNTESTHTSLVETTATASSAVDGRAHDDSAVEWEDEFSPYGPVYGQPAGGLLVSVGAGLIAGCLTVVSALSFAALIFAAELEQHLPLAVGMLLISGVIMPLAVAWGSSYSGTIAIPQDRIAPILALLAATVSASLGADADPQVRLYTVVGAIVLSTVISGGFLYLLGRFRLGGFIRFIPYPVVGGFLAGAGWLLAVGSIRVMTGAGAQEPIIGIISDPAQLSGWLPGAIFGVTLAIVLRRWRHFMVLPASLLLYVLFWFAVLYLNDLTLTDAQARGWLLGPFEAVGAWHYVVPAVLAQADWSAVLTAPAALGSVMLVSAVSLLLNSAALELEAKHDIHLNRELRVAGLANMASGVAGGSAGFHSYILSALAHRMGARGRWIGAGVALVCGVAFVAGIEVFGYFPRAALGGLLLFLGVSLMLDWVYDGASRLARGDYVVVLLILSTIGLVGYLEGMAVGLVGAVILFVLNYSRVDIVKHELTGREKRSNVDRPRQQERILNDRGDQLCILELQGYVFFGTANRLFNRVRHRVEGSAATGLRHVVVDFRRVTGFDSSATMSFVKLAQLGLRHNFVLVLSSVDRGSLQRFREGGLVIGSRGGTRIFDNMDYALEWCEDRSLSYGLLNTYSDLDVSIESQLAFLLAPAGSPSKMLRFLERMECKPGVTLIEQGAGADDLYFIEAGQVSVYLNRVDGRPIRLRKMGAGTVAGELGVYMGGQRTASVVTDTPAVVYRIGREQLDALSKAEPELAAAFHRNMARLIAERLVHANDSLRAVLN